ncbi:Structural maintenance of chromosomes protein 5 [Recurvomyces mirabilis]|nr:Structural maintenance of chromosomes protein 5 [Recurvomyces mirabilis]
MSDSGSVTPRRRRREEEDDEDEDQLYTGSGAKRARTDNNEYDDSNADDESVSEDGPLLPDNFRRSPQTQRQTGRPRQHQPGSLVRIEMTNFVTYSKAQFNLGPNLNMIIGPNGTGKSTLVCAICLGLGWKPENLGRAKLVGEFVKHGEKKAVIEIELAADPKRHAENPVITTRIIREGNKTEFAIDGKKVTKKELDALMKSFSIQIDNLCQFLPQDRVVEFAALSPVDLLTHTQRAAAPPQMHVWHDQLKTSRKAQKTKQVEQQALIDELKSKEQRQAQQQEIVERLRERSELQNRAAALEQLRPFPQYKAAKQRHTEAKDRKKDAERELKRLQRHVQPNLQAEEDKTEYLASVEAVALKRGKMVERLERTAADKRAELTSKQEDLDSCETRIIKAKDTSKGARANMPRLQQDKSKIERAMQTPPAQVDLASLNEQIREKTRLVRDTQERQTEIKHEIGSLAQRMKDRQQVMVDAEKEQETLQTQAGQQASKLKNASRDAHRAWEWIQSQENRFQGRVYGPPIVECTVTDPRYAAALENALGPGEMVAFTVTSRDDYFTLNRALHDELGMDNINIRQSEQPLAAFRAPCSSEQLQTLGLQSWILDLVEGPEPVLAMLCDNRNIHAMAYASRELNSARLDQLKSQSSPVSSWITPTEHYQVTRRREYGDRGTSVRTTALRQAKFFTDAPSAHNEDAEIAARVDAAKREHAECDEKRIALRAEYNDLVKRHEELQTQENDIKEEKRQKQTAQAHFAALPAKLTDAQRKIDDAKGSIDNAAAQCREIMSEGDKYTLEKGQLAIDYAFAVNTLREHIVQLVEAQILVIEAKSDLEQMQLRTRQEREMLHQREQEVRRLDEEMRALLNDGKRLRDLCQLVDMDDELVAQIYDNEVKDWDEIQLSAEIESVGATLNLSDGQGNQHVLAEYEKRAKVIEQKRSELADVEEALEGLDNEIKEVKEQWEPQLDQLISHISDAFADNFSKIQCAGEVGIHKDEDFELWAIQIKVKFRESEPLTLLDSHRQSGGERAVSTIFYLMALQSLARAPFRVVDEINQGMDPRNERLVHSRMVDIACSEESASQYFLITPKLLGGLKYHPDMRVHCIASGEHMPDDFRKLDFEVLARKALAIKASG